MIGAITSALKALALALGLIDKAADEAKSVKERNQGKVEQDDIAKTKSLDQARTANSARIESDRKSLGKRVLDTDSFRRD